MGRDKAGQVQDGVSVAEQSEMVNSLARGISVIKSFNEEHPVMTLSEVAQRSDMTRASTRRFLRTLQALGYVQAEGRYYRLRPKILELGYSYLASLPWWRPAQKVVERLAGEFSRPCAVGVIDRTDVLYVAHAVPVGTAAFQRSVGTRLPLFATAMGRVMLADLDEAEQDAYLNRIELLPITQYTVKDRAAFKRKLKQIRRDGYAVIDQELEVGLRQVGVPIVDRGGRVVSAISTSDHQPLATKPDVIERFVTPLREAAAEISEHIPT